MHTGIGIKVILANLVQQNILRAAQEAHDELEVHSRLTEVLRVGLGRVQVPARDADEGRHVADLLRVELLEERVKVALEEDI